MQVFYDFQSPQRQQQAFILISDLAMKAPHLIQPQHWPHLFHFSLVSLLSTDAHSTTSITCDSTRLGTCLAGPPLSRAYSQSSAVQFLWHMLTFLISTCEDSNQITTDCGEQLRHWISKNISPPSFATRLSRLNFDAEVVAVISGLSSAASRIIRGSIEGAGESLETRHLHAFAPPPPQSFTSQWRDVAWFWIDAIPSQPSCILSFKLFWLLSITEDAQLPSPPPFIATSHPLPFSQLLVCPIGAPSSPVDLLQVEKAAETCVRSKVAKCIQSRSLALPILALKVIGQWLVEENRPLAPPPLNDINSLASTLLVFALSQSDPVGCELFDECMTCLAKLSPPSASPVSTL